MLPGLITSHFDPEHQQNLNSALVFDFLRVFWDISRLDIIHDFFQNSRLILVLS